MIVKNGPRARRVAFAVRPLLLAFLFLVAHVPATAAGQWYGPFTFANAATTGTLRTPQTDDLWLVEPVEGSWPPQSIRFRSQSTGQYLHLEYGDIQASNIEPHWWSAMWVLENVGDYVRIRNRAKQDHYLYGVPYGAVTMAAAGPRSADDASAWWLMADAQIDAGAQAAANQPAVAPPGVDAQGSAVVLRIENYSAVEVDLYLDTDPNAPTFVETLPPRTAMQYQSMPGTVWLMAANGQWVGEYQVTNQPAQQLTLGE